MDYPDRIGKPLVNYYRRKPENCVSEFHNVKTRPENVMSDLYLMSGAWVGVGMLRGRGFLGFLVFGFKVSWFQGFEDLPNSHFIFSGRY